MNKVAVVGLLLATVSVLSGCASLNPRPTGQSSNTPGPSSGPPVGCVDGEADFTTSGGKYTMTGVCAKVVIAGNKIQVTAADIDHLTVSGNGNTVNVAVLSDVTIVGLNNTVKTTTAGPVTINGNSNTVTAAGPLGDVVVTGANDTVTTPASIGKVTQSGIGNKIGAP